jgi:hypothetical protein
VLFIIILSVVMLSVVMLRVVANKNIGLLETFRLGSQCLRSTLAYLSRELVPLKKKTFFVNDTIPE